MRSTKLLETGAPLISALSPLDGEWVTEGRVRGKRNGHIVRRSENSRTLWGTRGLVPPGRMHGSTAGETPAATSLNTRDSQNSPPSTQIIVVGCTQSNPSYLAA